MTRAQEGRLAALAMDTPWFAAALQAVRQLDLDSWCIGAGAVRNLVWDDLHGLAHPSALPDVDVAYFDDRNRTTELLLQQRLLGLAPGIPWEVTNQARVHDWYAAAYGQSMAPYTSLDEAVGSWPELSTAVGIWLSQDGDCRIIAPHGLDDLFAMVVRHNPVLASEATYLRRVAAKHYQARWPRVTILMPQT